MSTEWKDSKERSTGFLLRLSCWCAIHFGRRFLRIMLYPICLYYLFFTPRSKKHAKYYLQKVLQRPVTQKDHFKHYYTFASVILDRIYFLTNKHQYFDIRVHGLEHIKEAVAKQQGAILLGAHLGSFEALRALAFADEMPLKVLMHLGTSQKMTEYLHALNQQTQDAVITMGLPDSLLQVKEWLAQSGMIGILADRVFHKDKTILKQFLGEKAEFSTGPFRLLELFDVPVIFFTGLYLGGNRYEIHFERLSIENKDRPEILNNYIETLENHVHKAPYNWFNYYDYWKTS